MIKLIMETTDSKPSWVYLSKWWSCFLKLSCLCPRWASPFHIVWNKQRQVWKGRVPDYAVALRENGRRNIESPAPFRRTLRSGRVYTCEGPVAICQISRKVMRILPIYNASQQLLKRHQQSQTYSVLMLRLSICLSILVVARQHHHHSHDRFVEFFSRSGRHLTTSTTYLIMKQPNPFGGICSHI